MLDFTTWLKFTICLPENAQSDQYIRFLSQWTQKFITSHDNDVFVPCPKRPSYLISLFGNVHFNQVF